MVEELTLKSVKLGLVAEITTDQDVFWVTPVRGFRVEGETAFGLQITSGHGRSSMRLPNDTAANNIVRVGELWQFGVVGRLIGGVVRGIRVL